MGLRSISRKVFGGNRRTKRYKKLAAANAQTAQKLGEENQQLRSQNAQLRGLVGAYRGVAANATFQAAQANSNLFNAFAAGYASNPYAFQNAQVLGAMGHLTSGCSLDALGHASGAFCSSPAWSGPEARANLMHMLAYQQAGCF